MLLRRSYRGWCSAGYLAYCLEWEIAARDLLQTEPEALATGKETLAWGNSSAGCRRFAAVQQRLGGYFTGAVRVDCCLRPLARRVLLAPASHSSRAPVPHGTRIHWAGP